MISITINGKEFSAKKGETVLDVCRREGIYIPTLCYQEDLTPYGGCRLCIVEVEGMPRPMTACTLPVQEGMVIQTDTPRLKELRRFTLELILSEHPYSCLVCEKKTDCASYMECIEKEAITFGCKYCSANGNCELQKLVEEFGIKEIPYQFKYRNIPVEDYDPFFERDYNLCILCGRCVRACAELRCAYVIDFHHRGPRTLVGTAFNLSHIDANCQFCGACVDACPTGAMRERYNKYLGKPDKVIKTHCMLCSIGCPINAETRENKIIGTTPDGEPLCVRGRFGIAPMVNHPKRVTVPLLNKNGQLVEISWDDALDIASNILKEYKDRTGIIFSHDLHIETINSLSTFGEISGIENLGVEIQNVENFETLCLAKTGKKIAIIAVNFDLIQDFSVFLLRIKRALNEKPVVILVDPIKTKSAEIVDLYLRPEPGKEIEVLDILLSEDNPCETGGIKKEEIVTARKLLARREVCLLYNPYNVNINGLNSQVKCYPIFGILNFPILNSGKLSSAEDIFENDGIECLYLIGTGIPPMKKYKKVIVQNCFLPDFDFDLFLPAATFLEVDGSFIDLFGNEKKLYKVCEPPGQARADEWIIKNIIERLDFELPRKNHKYHPGRVNEKEKPDSEYPFYLIVRENTFKYRGKVLSKILTGFKRIHHDCRLWINPVDASRLKVENGKPVKVIGKDFESVVEVWITDNVPEGFLFAYHDREKGLVKNKRVRVECL
ncbi:MAG: 2Fe-2S iron-sulfur cluster-binding protein [candidate division WOR-3 bacterium]|nr:2Fe-2S iron-sulfur cluster-binding protein [candidate division WOR-3 bacterium]